MKDQFYVTLLSDSSMNMFPDNSQCCFKVKLPQAIAVEKQAWETALVELILPAQPMNITPEDTSFFVKISHATLIDLLHNENALNIHIPLKPKREGCIIKIIKLIKMDI